MFKQTLSWDNVSHLSDILADKIVLEAADLKKVILVAVSRGGLIPAQLIAYKLNIRDVRVLKLISYDENNVRHEIDDISTDALCGGNNVYFIDDMADSGETVKYIRSRFKDVKVCTLLSKKCCKFMPDISAKTDVASDAVLIFPWDKKSA